VNREVHLRLLGTPQVTCDGVPVKGFAYRKSVALLSYLAVTGCTHSREALAGFFWREATQANSRASLRKVLSELRRQMAPHLRITHQEVAFNEDGPFWLDVEVFKRCLNQSVMLPDEPMTDECAAALAQAVELYRGDFLEGLYVRGAPAFEEWALLEREFLRLMAFRALRGLTAYHLERRQFVHAIRHATRALALEPAQEWAHRRLMATLALDGQRSAALRQYATCCRVLARELGVEPMAETKALYEQILTQTSTPGLFLPPNP
jgi:DNA-binding SARP family transcriptional activator